MDMTKTHISKADRVANLILACAERQADEVFMRRDGVDSVYADFERGSFLTFRRGDIEYEVNVNSRRIETAA
jgi:hypothetical protein